MRVLRVVFFFSSRRRHTRCSRDWSSDVCSSDLPELPLDEVEIEIAEGASLAGGGSTPSQSLPTKIIRIASARYSATKLEQRLRGAPAGISVIARVEDDRLILDLRTVFPEQEEIGRAHV